MPSKNRYLYNGKEVQREVFGGYPLGWYDYGARGLNSDFCRFMSVDPMAQMYYPISPYVYCLNNPIKFVDPDGRDYRLSIKGSQITVNATYYTNAASAASARQAINFYNQQSGKYTYVVGKDENVTKYSVNFDLKVVEVEGDNKQVGRIATPNDNNDSNAYLTLTDSELEDKNGTTSSGRLIEIKESRSNSETGAHEVGHTLGLEHKSKGLMTSESSDPRRSKSISGDDVSDIINNPLRGKVGYEVNSKGETVNTGKGIVESDLTADELKKLRKGRVK